MITSVKTPFLGANDDEAILNGWLVTDGNEIEIGARIATVETTKTVIEIVAEIAGIFYALVEEGDQVRPGQLLAIIADAPLDDPEAALFALVDQQQTNSPAEKRVTKKAEILMARHGIELQELKA